MKNNKTQIQDYISYIYQEAKESKLESLFFQKIDKQLIFLAKYFNSTKKEAFLIALGFAINYRGDTINDGELIKYFNCNPIDFLCLDKDFESIQKQGIFKKIKARHRVGFTNMYMHYILDSDINKAIIKNLPFPKVKNNHNIDIYHILEELFDLVNQKEDNEQTTFDMFILSNEIIKSNVQFPLINNIKKLNLCREDTFLLCYVIWKTLSGYEQIDLASALEDIYDDNSTRLKYMQKFIIGNNPLVKLDLFELIESSFFNDTELKLSDKTLDLLNNSEIKLFKTKKRNENIISPTEIQLKNLFYNNEEEKQLKLLERLLQNDKLKITQTKLKSKRLPTGVTVLLHGSPSTGKTETVKQLAKKTNREIMQIDMSKTKSMWFGESQKIVKRIFTDYATFAKKCERTPILLFNEADALFTKRTETNDSSTSQTENTIQNILLEALENFEGILMATTNLAENLDTAFERRFLFKVKFQKPNFKVKSKIWKQSLSQLNNEECKKLSVAFDFSGGQIENIVRKTQITEILEEKCTTYINILDFCLQESLVGNKTGIGFIKNT